MNLSVFSKALDIFFPVTCVLVPEHVHHDLVWDKKIGGLVKSGDCKFLVWLRGLN